MVRPGHCIEMDNGTFAQVVLVLEMRDAASSLLCAVYPFRFVNGAQLSGGHPEAPSVPWLKRGLWDLFELRTQSGACTLSNCMAALHEPQVIWMSTFF